MRLLPGERFVIDTPASPDEVQERLQRVTASRRRLGRQTDVPFFGTVADDCFELRSILNYRNDFAPVARGSFRSGVAGTRVEVSLRLPRAVAVFVGGWLCFMTAMLVVGVVVAAQSPSRSWLALVALCLIAVMWGLVTAGFSFEARRMRENLSRVIVSGAPAAELRRVDVSWLSLRLQDAEPLERQFNRVFLVAYAIAGLLTVLTWERTIRGCSNAQYHHTERFSCPGDGRIALSWALTVLVIGACGASRLALHRRIRTAYAPLLALVVTVGAVSGWLMTHHPRWGVPR